MNFFYSFHSFHVITVSAQDLDFWTLNFGTSDSGLTIIIIIIIYSLGLNVTSSRHTWHVSTCPKTCLEVCELSGWFSLKFPCQKISKTPKFIFSYMWELIFIIKTIAHFLSWIFYFDTALWTWVFLRKQKIHLLLIVIFLSLKKLEKLFEIKSAQRQKLAKKETRPTVLQCQATSSTRY